MNVDRCRWGTSVVGVRILVAGLVLLGTGCAVLGWGARLAGFARTHDRAPKPSFPVDASSARSQATAHSVLAGLPLIFEPNQGQDNLDPADPRAQFVTHGSGYSLVFGSDGALLNLVSLPRSRGSSRDKNRFQVLEMKVAGRSSPAHLTGLEPLPGKSNYFIGNNPAKWRTGIPQFGRLRYGNVYPGIDLVFYGNQGHLEYDFQVAPGADPSRAELEFGGAKTLALKDGSLVIRTEDGSVELEAPRVYQEIQGRRQPVEGAFVLRAQNRVGFAVGTYDRSRELIIDPILNFSTYFGGSGDEHNTSVAVDASFNIYLTGSTTSADLPSKCSYPTCTTLNGSENVYVAKIQPPLGGLPAALLQLAYLGGSGTDYPVGIQVDGGENPYIAGTTTSGNFPTTPTNAYQGSPASAGTHVFVTRIKSDFSSLLYSSYLSSTGTDIATGMAIDAQSHLYVTGTTTCDQPPVPGCETSSTDQFPASNLPIAVPFQSTSHASAGVPQFFVTKVNPNAFGIASVAYSTYFGGGTFNGTAVATGGGIAVDTNQNVYFTGTTNFTYTGTSSVTDFPILNAYQPCLNTSPTTTIVPPQLCNPPSSSGNPDAFVAKLNTNPNVGQGQQLVWSTYLGGQGSDSGTGVALDSGAANVFVVGTTNSTDFVHQGFIQSFASYQACLNNNPITPPSGTVPSPGCPQPPLTPPQPNDAFVARVTNPTTASGTQVEVALGYFSYLGGANDETGTAIAVDSNSGAVITGSTNSPSSFTLSSGQFQPNAGTFPIFPYPSSIQSVLNNNPSQCPTTPCPSDAFVARLNTGATIGQTTTASWATFFGGSATDLGTGIALDVNQDTYLAGETNSSNLPVIKPEQACLDTPLSPAGTTCSGSPAQTDSFLTQLGTAVSLSITGVLNLGTGQQYISAGNPATFTYTVTNNGPDLASNIAILANFSQTGVSVNNVTATVSTGTCGSGGTNTNISCGPINLQSGSTATVTITLTPSAPANNTATNSISFNGGTVMALSADNIVLAQTSVSAQLSDFTMTVSPSNQAIQVAGDTATYAVQLTPRPAYGSSITVSCSGLPPASTCPSQTVTLSNTSGASVALNVTTTARPVTSPAASLFTRHFYAFWLMVPGMALVGIGGNRRRRRILGFLTLATLFALVLLIPACSSTRQTTPPIGTQAGNYSITITAAAGSDSKSQVVTLTVP